eukprot:gene22197-biopygen2714
MVTSSSCSAPRYLPLFGTPSEHRAESTPARAFVRWSYNTHHPSPSGAFTEAPLYTLLAFSGRAAAASSTERTRCCGKLSWEKVLAPGAERRVGTSTCTTDRFLTDSGGFFAVQPCTLGVPGFRGRHWNERESARPDVTMGPTSAPSLALKSAAFGGNPHVHVGSGR